MSTQTFRFQIVVQPEAGAWVAQCLNVDVAAQGATIHEAREALAQTLSEHIVLALHNGETPFDGLPAAPHEYWERFRSAERLADPEPIHVPPAFMINAMAEDVRVYA
jgi:hypothetical protein